MFKNLKLDRPIAFIDVETTGLKAYSDRIVELSIIKVTPDGKQEYLSRRINPGIPIPAEATAIHGITNADVINQPAFPQCAQIIRDFIGESDISGFNIIKFDLPFLEAEFARAKVEFSRQGRHLVDSQVIYHQQDPRDLAAAYRKYCGKELPMPEPRQKYWICSSGHIRTCQETFQNCASYAVKQKKTISILKANSYG